MSLLKTTVPELMSCQGNVVVPVFVENMENIASASLTLQFDTTILQFLYWQNLNPSLGPGTILLNSSNGKVQLAWYSLVPVTIDTGILIEFVFSGLTGSSSLNWDVQTQGACQYTNLNNIPKPANFVNGSITWVSCGNIGGTVRYDNTSMTPLTNTKVSALQNGLVIKQDTTDSQGGFQLTELMNGSYLLRGETNQLWSGGNAADALHVLKHVAGIVTLSGLKLAAADVDASLYVNSSDAMIIVKRFVGKIHSFPSGDWLFETDTVMVNNNNPTAGFRGLCFGDVNGSYMPGVKEGPGPVLVTEGIMMEEKGKPVLIPFKIQNDVQLGSISLILKFPYKNLHISSVNMEAEGEFVYHVTDDQLRLAWYNTEAWHAEQGQLLFNLSGEIVETEGFKSSEFRLMPSTIFTGTDGLEMEGIRLSLPEFMMKGDDPWLGQNIPNPFSESTIIPFYIPESSVVTISIHDPAAREVVLLADRIYSEGYHQLEFDNFHLQPGFYQYTMIVRVNDGHQRFTKKLIVE